ncbi:Slc4a3 [Symbiodinium sp. CCMP2592]|nr:Slc4a3 [Symbiodinium sp. CCMP2592]
MLHKILAGHVETPPGLDYVGGFCGGLRDDYRRRFAYFRSDWLTDVMKGKTVSGALFLFFATFTSTLALGKHINDVTHGVIGINEYMIMNSISGMLHSVLGCQPLLVLRPTGPITLLIEKLHEVSEWLVLPFWPLFAWTGIFVGIYMFIIAATELSRFIKYVTAFTENIFATFIGTVYINDGIQGMIRVWNSGATDIAARKLLVFNMTLGCTALAYYLSNIPSTAWGTYTIRKVLSDYALTISVFVLAIVAAVLDANFFGVDFIDTSSTGLTTTDGREWMTDMGSISATGVLVAAVAAIPIVMFFYLDQNISSLMCQKPEQMLGKGAYFHSSFACMAIFNLLGPIWGLPFVTGSLPHSPQFVGAMTETDEDYKPTGVVENRVAPFVGYLLMGVVLFLPDLLNKLPETAVSGALIFVGLKAALGTQLWERFLLLFTDPSKPRSGKGYSHLPLKTVHCFTLLQILMVVGCWLCNIYIGLGFPVFVASLIPFRFKVLPCLFKSEDIEALLTEEPEPPKGSKSDSDDSIENVVSEDVETAKVPAEYANLPRLDGRAVLEWTLTRGPDSGATKYVIDEELIEEAKFTMVIDGWSAPLSAGNFLDLVNRKFYNGLPIQRADGFIIQTGDPGADKGNGFSPGPGQPVRTIPLEVGIRGRKEALYGETIDEARLVGTEVKIPFQADGTIALARREFDNDSEPALAFMFLFESVALLADLG